MDLYKQEDNEQYLLYCTVHVDFTNATESSQNTTLARLELVVETKFNIKKNQSK